MQIKDLERWVWKKSMHFFSLDVATVLYEDLGLMLDNKDNFHQYIKNLISENISSIDKNAEWYIDVAEHVLMKYPEINVRDSVSFENWVNCRFALLGVDQLHWSIWKDVFESMYKEKENAEILLFKNKYKDFFLKYYKALDFKDLSEKLDNINKKQLSGWDFNLYSLYGYTQIENLQFLFQTYEIFNFQKFCSIELPNVKKIDLEYIYNYGKNYLKVEKLISLVEASGGLKDPNFLMKSICLK